MIGISVTAAAAGRTETQFVKAKMPNKSPLIIIIIVTLLTSSTSLLLE